MVDELKTLVVDESDLAHEVIADALRPYVRLTAQGGILLEPLFDDLTTERQVLCVLLSAQALRMLGYRDTALLSPAEIVELSAMAPGSVRPKLSALTKRRRIAKEDGKYTIPPPAARRAAELLRAHDDD